MRTLKEIRASIQANFIANSTIQSIYSIDGSKTFEEQFSKVCLESVLIDVFAICSYTLESIFQRHKTDVANFIKEEKAHTLKWYRNKALAFRLGQDLVEDSDVYSDVGLTEEEIAASKIIAYAAAIESEDGSGTPLLRIKLAKSNFAILSNSELEAISFYFKEIKDAGVKLLCTSNAGDGLKVNATVYYDPKLITSAGFSTSTGEELVRIAVVKYLKSLPFNGEFTPMALTDVIQAIPGVEICQINETLARYGTLSYSSTGARYIPDAGWMRLESPEDLVVNYIPYTPNA